MYSREVIADGRYIVRSGAAGSMGGSVSGVVGVDGGEKGEVAGESKSRGEAGLMMVSVVVIAT